MIQKIYLSIEIKNLNYKKYTRFFLIKSIYYLQDKQTLDMRLSEDALSDDSEVYFIGIDKTDNPLDDNLDEWYIDILQT